MDWAILVLRLGLGIMFAAHGLQKAFGLFGGPGIAGVSKMMESLGFSPVSFWAYLLAYVELLAGLAVVAGLCVRTSSALLLIVAVVAFFKVHMAKGFFLTSGGFEYIFVIASICLALIILGAGKFGVSDKF